MQPLLLVSMLAVPSSGGEESYMLATLKGPRLTDAGVMSKNEFSAMNPRNRPRFFGFYGTDQAVQWLWGVCCVLRARICISRWAVLTAWDILM